MAKDEEWTAEEKAAMKERAKELKTSGRKGKAVSREDAEVEVLAKIATMPEPDRGLAERVHKIVMASGPDLMPRLWYGMPAYAKDGKVLCFFQDAAKFKYRYSTLGFQDVAALDDGSMWPTSYALTKLTKADEKRIAELVKQAVS